MSAYYIGLTEAKPVLQPRMPVFADALRKAVHEWNNGLGQYHAELDEFARSVIINQFWFAAAKNALYGDGGVSSGKHGNGYYFVVDGILVIRFKHLDESYKTWNHPTPRSRAMEAQLPFRSIPPLARLDLGYHLDLTGTVVETAMVMFNRNRRSVWRWQIWGHPIDEFAAMPRNQFGDATYVHDDYSGVALR